MARESDKGAFERDFGYLVPFFDRVEAAAANLTAPGAPDELRRLMAGEKARWTRIRELLAGEAGRGPAVQPSAPGPARSPANPVPRNELPREFTIGPLKVPR